MLCFFQKLYAAEAIESFCMLGKAKYVLFSFKGDRTRGQGVPTRNHQEGGQGQDPGDQGQGQRNAPGKQNKIYGILLESNLLNPFPHTINEQQSSYQKKSLKEHYELF